MKFSYLAFKELNNTLINTFYGSQQVKRWHGLRLLAVTVQLLSYQKINGCWNILERLEVYQFNPL